MKTKAPIMIAGILPWPEKWSAQATYLCPVSLSDLQILGQTTIHSRLSLEPGAELYIINAPFCISSLAKSDAGIVFHKESQLSILGNQISHLCLHLGGKGLSYIQLNGGKLIMPKGNILGGPNATIHIHVNSGFLSARSIHLPGNESEIHLNGGTLRSNRITGNVSIKINGGLLHVREQCQTRRLQLMDKGVLLINGNLSRHPAEIIGHAGINFYKEGGTLLIRLHYHKMTNSHKFSAKDCLSRLIEENKLYHNGIALGGLNNFHFCEFVGKDGFHYAMIQPQTHDTSSRINKFLDTLINGQKSEVNLHKLTF